MACYTEKTMITLLLGTDELAKKQYILDTVTAQAAELQIFTEVGGLNLLQLFEPQLFGAPKVVMLDHVYKQLDTAQILDQIGNNKTAHLFLAEDSIDKRVSANKEFLKDARVKVIEFNAPVGLGDSVVWIRQFAKNHQIKLDSAVATKLANTILLDQEASLPVLRAQNELLKLKSYAGGAEVTTEMVESLVENVFSIDVYALTNAIAAKNKQLAMQLLNDYFKTESGDEKSNAIKVTALLAEQFRSFLIALDAQSRRMSEPEILALTGWSSKRLFMVNKTARNFTIPKLSQALLKLENLDREMKTGAMPPHVVLDLIIADL